MFRWYIIRTLLYKEVLRYRYNWGLLMVVMALLALSGLVAVSSRFNRIPGQGSAEVQTCHIYYCRGELSDPWIAHLRQNPPPSGGLHFHARASGTAIRPVVREGEMGVELAAPGSKGLLGWLPRNGWKVRYWYADESAPGMMAYRDWLERTSNDYLGTSPRLEVETHKAAAPPGTEPVERLPLIVASLTIFALYLLSFNLFITSTGEEREKKVLLALLLSPAAPSELLASKALFYGGSSLAVGLAVVGMYDPALLLQPLLWLTIVCGSVAYVAIGTIVISIVRRQTTINTLSMLYLITTSIIMILSEFLPPFAVLKALLIEHYLYAQVKHLVAGQSYPWMLANQVVLLAGTIAWCIAAGWIFTRKATSIVRSR